MSKGEIVEHLGEALYRVKLKYAVEQVKAQLDAINERIAELAAEIPSAKTQMLQLQSEADSIKASINAEIPNYADDVEGALEELKRLQVLLIRKQGEINKKQYTLDLLISENLSLLKRRGQIERIPEEKELEAWCADFVEDLTGEIGLIDLNDEGNYGAIIQPGFSEEAGYSGARDGVLVPREAQSANQAYLNAALLPGVQKFRPRYRIGTISNIVNDTCTVFLDSATSSAQGLNINRFDFYSKVPVVYMDCNAQVFEEGDKVLVRFTSSGPLVVGFASQPKECDAGDFAFIPAQYDEGTLTTFGLPEIPGDPLGTPGGDNPAWFYRQDRAGSWDFKKYRQAAYGPQNWESADGLVVSWGGGPGRLHSNSTPAPNTNGMFFRRSEIYCNGKEVADIDTVIGGADVYGAAVNNGKLIIIALSTFTWNVIEFPWQGRSTTGPGTIVDSFPRETDYVIGSGWHFNQRGDEAVLTLRKDQEKVAKRKYLVGAGIQPTEVIWERDYQGTGTNLYSPITDTTAYEESGVTWVQHDIPIYVDFVGNSEVTLFLRHRQRESLATLNSDTDVYTYADNQSATDFILSTGEVLATIGPTYDQSIYWTSDESELPPSMSYSETIESRFAPGASFFADIRKKVVAFDVIENEYTASFSGVSDNGTVPGSSEDKGRRVYEMHVAGVLTLSFIMQKYTHGESGRAYESVPDTLGSAGSQVLGPEAPSVNLGNFVNVGYESSEGKSLSTMFAGWSEGISNDGVEEVAFANAVTGYTNPDLQLFDGRENMTMYALGRI